MHGSWYYDYDEPLLCVFFLFCYVEYFLNVASQTLPVRCQIKPVSYV